MLSPSEATCRATLSHVAARKSLLQSRMVRAMCGGLMVVLVSGVGRTQSGSNAEYVVGAGDVLHITVLQNPDLTIESRVSELGTLSFPYIGSVQVGGLSVSQSEKKIADMLREGNFVPNPQVNILPVQMRSAQVAVLGHVNRPGRYPLETVNMRLSALLAVAGGIAPTGADTVVLMGTRKGKPIRKEIDVPMLVQKGNGADDFLVESGDVLYVNRAPVFYIYGEVQHPGAFRLERDMTLMQGLAMGGGLTTRGTEKGLRVYRRDGHATLQLNDVQPDSPLQADDVIYVREGRF
jgi:polysaccharide export outer membrane protein